MARIYSFIARILFLLAFAPLRVIAAVGPAASADITPIKKILTNILSLLTVTVQILITLAFVVFGWGIVKLIINAGNPQKVKDAKKILLWGIVGIFILASLFGIVTFIKTYTGIPNVSPNITPPKFTL